jgi:hypothetical protein
MWATCAIVTLTVLLVGLHQLLPGYEQRFSLREHIQPQFMMSKRSDVRVVCYPRRWDSVSFYLGRNDVRVFGLDLRSELISELRQSPGTILFVKTDTLDKTPLRDLLRELPASLEFVPHSRHGIVTAGIVRRREEAPSMLLVKRDVP